MNRPKAPKPTIVQRSVVGLARGITNFGDEVYGVKVDRDARARQDRNDLNRIVLEDAQAREFLDESMPENTDLLTREDEFGTEFSDVMIREFIKKFGRDPSRSERRYVQEYAQEFLQDLDGDKAREFLDERMKENTDLLVADDQTGREFTQCVVDGMRQQFGRGPSADEVTYIQEFVAEWVRDLDGQGA